MSFILLNAEWTDVEAKTAPDVFMLSFSGHFQTAGWRRRSYKPSRRVLAEG